MVDPTIWLIVMFLFLSPIIIGAIFTVKELKKWPRDVVLWGFFLFFTGTSVYMSYGILERYITRSAAVQYWGQTGDWKTPEAIAVGAKQILAEEGEIYWYPYFFSGMPSITLGWYGTKWQIEHSSVVMWWHIMAVFLLPLWGHARFGYKGLFLGAFVATFVFGWAPIGPFLIFVILDLVNIDEKKDKKKHEKEKSKNNNNAKT